MKAVPSNREVTQAVLRLRDGPSEGHADYARAAAHSVLP